MDLIKVFFSEPIRMIVAWSQLRCSLSVSTLLCFPRQFSRCVWRAQLLVPRLSWRSSCLDLEQQISVWKTLSEWFRSRFSWIGAYRVRTRSVISWTGADSSMLSMAKFLWWLLAEILMSFWRFEACWSELKLSAWSMSVITFVCVDSYCLGKSIVDFCLLILLMRLTVAKSLVAIFRYVFFQSILLPFVDIALLFAVERRKLVGQKWFVWLTIQTILAVSSFLWFSGCLGSLTTCCCSFFTMNCWRILNGIIVWHLSNLINF